MLGSKIFVDAERALAFSRLVRPHLETYLRIFDASLTSAQEHGTRFHIKHVASLPKYVVLPKTPAGDGRFEVLAEAELSNGRKWRLIFGTGGANSGEERPPEMILGVGRQSEGSLLNHLVLRIERESEELFFSFKTALQGEIKNTIECENVPIKDLPSKLESDLKMLISREYS